MCADIITNTKLDPEKNYNILKNGGNGKKRQKTAHKKYWQTVKKCENLEKLREKKYMILG